MAVITRRAKFASSPPPGSIVNSSCLSILLLRAQAPTATQHIVSNVHEKPGTSSHNHIAQEIGPGRSSWFVP